MNCILSFNEVSHSYHYGDTTHLVLDRLSIDIMESEFVMLTGPSGSGKSTILHLGSLLDSPDRGSILFDGRIVDSMTDDEQSALRACAMGFVFQSYQLLPRRSVLENVLFRFRYLDTSTRVAREQSEWALQQVGLLPLINKQVRLLSGGEMQRVAIARAIAAQPRMLFADEPTGNLDQATSTSILDLLSTLNKQGLTILMATHDERLLRFATNWYQLDQEKLVYRNLPRVIG